MNFTEKLCEKKIPTRQSGDKSLILRLPQNDVFSNRFVEKLRRIGNLGEDFDDF